MDTLNSQNDFFPIKVSGTTMGEKVIILIDGGATQNFIDERFIENIRLETQTHCKFGVII